MEVFLRNLPNQGNFSERVLQAQLRPFMQKLDIADHTYECAKPLKKNHGFITFLNNADGVRFLAMYGETRPYRSRSRSALIILGASVKCTKSNKPANDIILRGLRMQDDEAKKVLARDKAARDVSRDQSRSQSRDQSRDQSAVSTARAPFVTDSIPAPTAQGSDPLMAFSLINLSCGYYQFDKDMLVYVSEFSNYESGTAKFGKRNLAINLNDNKLIHIPLNTIHEVVWSQDGFLTLTLMSAPLFYLEFTLSEQKRLRLTALDKQHAQVVGTCLIYRLSVHPDQMHRKMARLGSQGILSITPFDVPPRIGPDYAQSLRTLAATLSAATTANALPFAILFQLQALVYNAYLHPDTVAALAGKLINLQKKKTPISTDAMKKLFYEVDWPTPNYEDPSLFEAPALADYLLDQEDELQQSAEFRKGLFRATGNLTPISRVIITPTRMTLHGPELENKNRVLRKFPDHHDYFIRVQFSDENGGDLRFNSASLEAVYDRFKKIMIDGLQIAGRTYKFLGWSHSSLRAHSMWFVAPFFDGTGLQSHLTIIKGLGTFTEIHSPAKCAARIGQAFSETPFAVPLAGQDVTIYADPDVLSDDGSRMFSDGVGTISTSAVQMVWDHLPNSKNLPTCFQIRFAGAKGMLSLDSRLAAREIHLRASMIKFQSDERANLEICDTAQPIPLFLNRQLIKILEDMGVPHSWFRRLQDDALRELRLITATAFNMAQFLKQQSVASCIKLHKLLLWADKHGLDYRSDPFLRRVTEAVVLRELRLLKHRARMLVPFGITLFGVMDETGYLQEDEVYVTFESKAGSRSQRFRPPPTHCAALLVTRSPALHPGDIQAAINTIPPSGHPLRQLTNCIVFSARGTRDLPSQLSGGDLDGDIFNVIWDRAVHIDDLKIFKPADYPRQDPVDIGRAVETEDIAQFFVDFMRTDHLGMVATRHMILADQKEAGTLDWECIALAEMHSTAVDFSKTGKPVDPRTLPRAAKFRPDFLSPGPLAHVYDRADIELEEYMHTDDTRDPDSIEGPAHKYYKSTKILGLLYRAIDERKIWYDDIRAAKPGPGPGAQQPDLYKAFLSWANARCADLGCRPGGWQQRRGDATRIRMAYDDAVSNAMHEFSEHPMQPLTELEVFIGSVLNKTGSQSTRQRDRSRKLRDEFERIATWITGLIRPRDRTIDPEDADAAEEGSLLDTLHLCLACAHQRPTLLTEPAADGDRGGGRNSTAVSSFWLVAASALLREVEFVRRARAPEAGNDLSQRLSQLAVR